MSTNYAVLWLPGQSRSLSQQLMIDQSVEREHWAAQRKLACNDIIMRVLLTSLHSVCLMFKLWASLNTADNPGNINNGGDSGGDTAAITIT